MLLTLLPRPLSWFVELIICLEIKIWVSVQTDMKNVNKTLAKFHSLVFCTRYSKLAHKQNKWMPWHFWELLRQTSIWNYHLSKTNGCRHPSEGGTPWGTISALFCANLPTLSIWPKRCHSASPTNACPNLLRDTIRAYNQHEMLARSSPCRAYLKQMSKLLNRT